MLMLLALGCATQNCVGLTASTQPSLGHHMPPIHLRHMAPGLGFATAKSIFARTWKTRKLCYRKDDRAMRPIYRLFYHNFVHAYVHYFARI